MRTSILTMVLLASLICISAYAYDDGDFQVWNTENQELNINKVSKITFEQELRWGDNASELYYQHYDAGFVYSANEHLDLGINYRQVYEKNNDKFKEENRPHINAILKYTVAGFKLDDRNRLEYRHFDWQEDFWEYRNKFTLKFPWRFTKLQFQPYLADEVFLHLNAIDLTRNRLYGGFGFTIFRNLKGEIYYLLQTSKSSGSWKDANVLGTKIKLVF